MPRTYGPSKRPGHSAADNDGCSPHMAIGVRNEERNESAKLFRLSDTLNAKVPHLHIGRVLQLQTLRLGKAFNL